MTPERMEWTVGADIHGRRVRLVRTTQSGRLEWWILRDAGNQRDESAVLYSLTPEVLVAMGKIAEEHR